MARNIIGLVTLVLFVMSAPLIAGEKVEKSEHATFDGKLVCLGCDLKKAEGARAACSAFGHRHALKTKDGKYVNFLDNQYSADLLKGEKYNNKDITVHGVYYADANLVDVETFTVDGKSMGWCGHCSTMDGCAAKAGKASM